MSIFSIFTLCGGLAFFLYGISIMSAGLEKIAGGKLEKILRKMTSSPLKSLALGAGITALIQSSSAVTVIIALPVLVSMSTICLASAFSTNMFGIDLPSATVSR